MFHLLTTICFLTHFHFPLDKEKKSRGQQICEVENIVKEQKTLGNAELDKQRVGGKIKKNSKSSVTLKSEFLTVV